MVVLRPVASMYSAPSESADVVSQAILGSNVELVEQRAGWIKVRTADQYQGWNRMVSFNNLVGDTGDGAADVLRGHDDF